VTTNDVLFDWELDLTSHIILAQISNKSNRNFSQN